MEAGYLTNFIPNIRALKHCSYYQLLTDRPLLDKQCDYIILNSKSKNLFQPSKTVLISALIGKQICQNGYIDNKPILADNINEPIY